MKAGEQRQYNRLVRHFAYRLVDHELIAQDGEVHQTLTQALAITGGLSFTLSLILVWKNFSLSGMIRPERLALSQWFDEWLLIVFSMAVTSFFGIMAWDALFPDRKDAVTLGILPVRWQVMANAKLTAISMVVGLLLLSSLSFHALVFPAALSSNAGWVQLLRNYAAHFLTMTAAGGTAFAALFALQGLLVLLLPYPMFRRVASWIQLGLLSGLLTGMVLIPGVDGIIRHPEWARWLPPYWFLDLYQQIRGVPSPTPNSLAGWAWASLIGTAAIGLLCFTFGFRRVLTKVVEQGDASRPIAPWGPSLLPYFVRKPRQMAVFRFMARTVFRNPRHRLLLAIYCGTGLAYVMMGIKLYLEQSRLGALARPSAGVLSIPLDFAFFLLVGLRVLFSQPVELPANWIFRFTEGGEPSDYLDGARKFLWAIGVLPLSLLPFPMYMLLWGWVVAFKHAVMTLVLTAILVEILMNNFRKIPFTCAFLPGKGNMKVRLGVGAIAFLSTSYFVAAVETALLGSNRAFLIFCGLSAIILLGLWRRRTELERGWAFQFEERADWWISRLELSR